LDSQECHIEAPQFAEYFLPHYKNLSPEIVHKIAAPFSGII
jgi:hypothetical protein